MTHMLGYEFVCKALIKTNRIEFIDSSICNASDRWILEFCLDRVRYTFSRESIDSAYTDAIFIVEKTTPVEMKLKADVVGFNAANAALGAAVATYCDDADTQRCTWGGLVDTVAAYIGNAHTEACIVAEIVFEGRCRVN